MPRLTRRQFHHTLLGAMAVPCLPSFAQAKGSALLRAVESKAQLAPPNHPQTAVWGYDGAVPGPVLRVKQGTRLQRRFQNDLPQPSSIHWHGVRIENAMDGVPGMTQDPVAPGAAFDYDFAVPDAGTYWYHPHNRTYEQMARGLYGALIVEEPEQAPEVDEDIVLLIDDWRLDETAQIAEDFGNMHDWSHAGRIGNWLTVNGDGAWSQTLPRHARLRLRLVNTANARIFALNLRGLEGWVVALDGMPLEAPSPIDQLVLAPAQRADLIVDLVAEEGEDAMIASPTRGGLLRVATFPVQGSLRSEPGPAPQALPPNPVPALGPLEDARQAELVMQGGAMGGMGHAMMGGESKGIRDLAAAGKIWAFNGRVDLSDQPLIEANRGETIRIRIANDTAWPHAMHLHGHHFRQIRADSSTGPLRDTLLMDRQETAEIAFVADNPGDWLLHCHMLEHSSGGMMSWLRVS